MLAPWGASSIISFMSYTKWGTDVPRSRWWGSGHLLLLSGLRASDSNNYFMVLTVGSPRQFSRSDSHSQIMAMAGVILNVSSLITGWLGPPVALSPRAAHVTPPCGLDFMASQLDSKSKHPRNWSKLYRLLKNKTKQILLWVHYRLTGSC